MAITVREVQNLTLCSIALVLPACSRDRIVPEVILPGSPVRVLLTEDAKKMYSVRLTEGGKTIAGVKLLGPRYFERCPAPTVAFTADNDLATIRWGTDVQHHYLIVDMKTLKMISSSNSAW